MSERDLPSRVLSEHNHNTSTMNGGRNILPPHAPIHSSKSVPSLNSKYHLTYQSTNLLLLFSSRVSQVELSSNIDSVAILYLF